MPTQVDWWIPIHVPGAPMTMSFDDEDDYHRKDDVLSKFLRLTQPVNVWQEPLIHFMRGYIIKEDYVQAMCFFAHVIQEGLVAHAKRSERLKNTNLRNGHRRVPKPTFVEFNNNLWPKVLDMDKWKNILIALGFEIEEPDGYYRREDISLAVGDGVMTAVLDGMLLLLTSLQEIPWQFLTMLTRMSSDDAINLDIMLLSLPGPVPNQKEAKGMCNKYPGEMKELGFHTEQKSVVKRSSCHVDVNLHLAIKGLFYGTPKNGDVYV